MESNVPDIRPLRISTGNKNWYGKVLFFLSNLWFKTGLAGQGKGEKSKENVYLKTFRCSLWKIKCPNSKTSVASSQNRQFCPINIINANNCTHHENCERIKWVTVGQVVIEVWYLEVFRGCDSCPLLIGGRHLLLDSLWLWFFCLTHCQLAPGLSSGLAAGSFCWVITFTLLMQRQVVALVLRLPTPCPETPGKLPVYFNKSVCFFWIQSGLVGWFYFFLEWRPSKAQISD